MKFFISLLIICSFFNSCSSTAVPPLPKLKIINKTNEKIIVKQYQTKNRADIPKNKPLNKKGDSVDLDIYDMNNRSIIMLEFVKAFKETGSASGDDLDISSKNLSFKRVDFKYMKNKRIDIRDSISVTILFSNTNLKNGNTFFDQMLITGGTIEVGDDPDPGYEN